jgi:hypothetical protein
MTKQVDLIRLVLALEKKVSSKWRKSDVAIYIIKETLGFDFQ